MKHLSEVSHGAVRGHGAVTAPELTADQVMRVIAALEAAWAHDSDASAAVVGGGRDGTRRTRRDREGVY
ncbi:hypothetical protein [Streptomyces sp. NPDC014676]|uniref:hypothetical protein n=1 Tax=Streptomyces sp. NPDC014676 TaxID=3364879 RepID=UPI0037025A60